MSWIAAFDICPGQTHMLRPNTALHEKMADVGTVSSAPGGHSSLAGDSLWGGGTLLPA